MADRQRVQNLSPQRVQTWTLVSLRPVHRAIVIHAARRMHMAASIASLHAQPTTLQWATVANTLADPWAFRTAMETVNSSVVLIDRSALLDNLLHCESAFQFPAGKSIRLLWSWGMQTNNDLAWCTDLGFHGNIFNMPSLEQWCHIGVQRASAKQQPASPLLSGIHLPKIHETI